MTRKKIKLEHIGHGSHIVYTYVSPWLTLSETKLLPFNLNLHTFSLLYDDFLFTPYIDSFAGPCTPAQYGIIITLI